MKFARCFRYLLPLTVGCTSSRGDVFASRESPPVCAPDIYCTGFETTSDALEQSGTGSAELVTSFTHSGKSALRVSVAGIDDWARFVLPLSGLTQVGLRFWVMLDANASDFGVSEVHVLAALHPSPELGVGGRDKVSIDLESGFRLALVETVTPTKTYAKAALPLGTWHCLRLQIGGPAGSEQATFEMDGMAQAMTNTHPSVVVAGGFQSLYLGIEYSTGPTPLVLYYDDLIVGQSAAPCSG